MRKAIASAIIYIAPFILTQQAFAQTVVGCPTGTFAFLCTLTIARTIGAVITFIFVISAVACLAYLMFGWISMGTSRGDAKQNGAVGKHIVAAIVGLIIIFLSFLVMNIALGFCHTKIFSLPNPSL